MSVRFGRLLIAAVTGALVCGIGCGGAESAHGPFSLSSQAGNGASFAEVRRILAERTPAPSVDVAVGVTKAGLAGMLLPGGQRWGASVTMTSAPVVAGSLVIALGDRSLKAFDARTGSTLWSFDGKFSSLVGADDDGKLTLLSLLRDARSYVVAVDRDGNVVFESAPDTNVGTPAVLGGIGFVPWGNQFVSAIELSSGDELGRLILGHQTSRALRFARSFYFGESAFVVFDSAQNHPAPEAQKPLSLPPRELPGGPRWQIGVTQSLGASALRNIQVFARPVSAKGGLAFSQDRFVSTYFRVVLGLDSKSGDLHWVRTLAKDVVGGAATEDGFVLCSSDGTLEFLSGKDGSAATPASTGEPKSRALSFGEPISACAIVLDSVRFGGAPRRESLPEQMAEALTTSHAQMATVQGFLLDELSKRTEPIVTKTLIEVLQNPRTATNLRERARGLLAGRRNGADYMLSALEREYDFLDDVLSAPPVGALAEALAAMNERRAAPLLARHLNDPANSPTDVERSAAALSELASASELSELKMFFALYRATADEEALLDAVAHVAKALLKIGGSEGRQIVETAATDPLTHPTLKQKLGTLIRRG